MYLAYILVGLGVGILAGFMGIGGGLVLVPALVYVLHLSQLTAQGTSLFMTLPPLGLGALLIYWKKGHVDLNAGIAIALGFFLGGFLGSKMALVLPAKILLQSFGLFLIVSAALLWRKGEPRTSRVAGHAMNSKLRLFLILVMACFVGVAGGLFGVGGGVLLVPLLVVLFGFEQHRAQGTSLVALVPPTGLLAFINYARAGQVSWTGGLLIMPGIFFGAVAGSRMAEKLSSKELRRMVAVLVFLLGVWEVISPWLK